MSVFETVVIVIGAINILLLVLTFLTYTSLISAKVHINQMHVGMATILGKVMSLEVVTSKMAAGFTEVIALTEDMISRTEMQAGGYSAQLFKTKDGKYTAKTLDELLNKIKEDDAESEYFSDSDLDKLRELFGDDWEDDDEEDDTLDDEK
jgi:hypothetical protein